MRAIFQSPVHALGSLTAMGSKPSFAICQYWQVLDLYDPFFLKHKIGIILLGASDAKS